MYFVKNRAAWFFAILSLPASAAESPWVGSAIGVTLSDTVIAQRIRAEMLADDGVARNAVSVQVIAENGQVTLLGPVRSTTEKLQMEQLAIRIAGRGVINGLQVIELP